MVKSRTLTLLGLLLTASCDQDPRPLTQLVLVADTDVSALQAVRFMVQSDDGSRSEEAIITRGDMPTFVSVVRDEGPLGPLTVTAMGLVNGESAGFVRKQRVSFVPDQTRVVKMHLAASCIGKVCAEGETCSEVGCVPVEVPAEQLEKWSGTPPALSGAPEDAGVPKVDASNHDAGDDARVADAGAPDAAGPVDSGAVDAGASDAGTDAGQVDSGLTACDGGSYNLQTDPYHCGTCTKKCDDATSILNPLDRSIYSCVQGQCSLLQTQCQHLYGDCNGILGCEAYLGDDVSNCGACGYKCSTVGKNSCVLGVCQ